VIFSWVDDIRAVNMPFMMFIKTPMNCTKANKVYHFKYSQVSIPFFINVVVAPRKVKFSRSQVGEIPIA
jgi:hypothetical protein